MKLKHVYGEINRNLCVTRSDFIFFVDKEDPLLLTQGKQQNKTMSPWIGENFIIKTKIIFKNFKHTSNSRNLNKTLLYFDLNILQLHNIQQLKNLLKTRILSPEKK